MSTNDIIKKSILESFNSDITDNYYKYGDYNIDCTIYLCYLSIMF